VFSGRVITRRVQTPQNLVRRAGQELQDLHQTGRLDFS